MKRLKLLLVLVTFIFVPATTSAKIDDSNIKSIVQIKIWDTYKSEYIATGTGVFVDVVTVLTNYHVVEDAVTNPSRYLPMVCLTEDSLLQSNCKYFGGFYGVLGKTEIDQTPQVSEELDLALLTITKFVKNNEIKRIAYSPFSDWSDLASHKQISISIYGEELTGLKTGDQVQTLGYPAEGGNTITYSNGSIINFQVNKYNRVLSIITSARIGPGSSGGAAFDSYGKFIGITSGGYLDSDGNFISGVIIPVSTVNWWMKEIEGYRINSDDEYTKSDIPDDVIKQALCLLGYNHHWDENSGTCVCDSGYYENDKRVCIKEEIIISPEIKGVDDILIPEGAIIKNTNNPDIYIVKYVGLKKFKRLILNPSVFNNYGHLKWEDVMDVSQSTLNSFTTSELVRAVGDNKIYRLYPQGDIGQKRMIKNNSVLTRLGLDADSIYEINSFDRESYVKGLDLE